jgi:anti-anti-sigma factor
VEEDDALSVDSHVQNGVPFVTARGDVDLCSEPALKTVLESACAQRTEPGPLAVDLRDVGFIDSAGLALLVEMRKRYLDTCQIALVIAPGSQPERVLKLGRFDTFLKVCYSPDEVMPGNDSKSGDATAAAA